MRCSRPMTSKRLRSPYAPDSSRDWSLSAPQCRPFPPQGFVPESNSFSEIEVESSEKESDLNAIACYSLSKTLVRSRHSESCRQIKGEDYPVCFSRASRRTRH